MHTKGPWKVESGMVFTEDDIPIAMMHREIGNGTSPVERDANAHFIVKACNSHAELLEALRLIAEDTIEGNVLQSTMTKALDAIAKAT